MVKKRSGAELFMMHTACFLLVVIYVNMFQFWAWVSRELGPGLLLKTLPFMMTILVLLALSIRFIRRVNRGYRIRLGFIGVGIVGAFLALAIPDPHLPIKRIHVAEYILLSFLVRYVLSHRLQRGHLVVFTILVTALYGVHDEMIQGLHSLRYFGWRDIIVNAVAGFGGAMLGHGLICFEDEGLAESLGPVPRVTVVQAVLFAGLLGAVVWQVAYLYRLHGKTPAYLALAPVIACCLLIGVFQRKMILGSENHHGLQVIFWLSLGLIVYPVLAALEGIEFL